MNANENTIFSLIIATLNRAKAIELCLQSLEIQTEKRFEAIIVDQSSDESTMHVVNSFCDSRFKYFNVEFKGLSKARNFGLEKACGQYFCLIDDDAYYPEEYLSLIYAKISKFDNRILVGRLVDYKSKKDVFDYSRCKDNGKLNIRQIMRVAPSAGITFPMSIYEKGISFDVLMGAGGKFGACEETDVVLQALDMGYEIYFSNDILYYHPTIEKECTEDQKIHKTGSYARGLGALFYKDIKDRHCKRLIPYYIEKKIKLYLKSLGICGKYKKLSAAAEKKGIQEGLKLYKTC